MRVSHRLPLTPVLEGIVPSIGSEDVGRSVMVDSTPPPGATSGRIAGHMHIHITRKRSVATTLVQHVHSLAVDMAGSMERPPPPILGLPSNPSTTTTAVRTV